MKAMAYQQHGHLRELQEPDTPVVNPVVNDELRSHPRGDRTVMTTATVASMPAALGSATTETEEGRDFFQQRLGLFGMWLFILSSGFNMVTCVNSRSPTRRSSTRSSTMNCARTRGATEQS